MRVRIIGSTKLGYELTPDKAKRISGLEAGICYMPKSFDELENEPKEKTFKRAERTANNKHHSVFGHPHYNFYFEGVPKILAMILNNEGIYNTSEKSARYTKMSTLGREKELYNKWIRIFKEVIYEKYPEKFPKKEDGADNPALEKMAMENARYLISIFTPSTSMGYTVSFQQMNYLLHFMKDFILNGKETEFNIYLKNVFKEFTTLFEREFSDFIQDNLKDPKERSFSLFANRVRKEEFGENYSVNYLATFSQVAQAQRHRTINYEIIVPDYKDAPFYTPLIIQKTDLEGEWLYDISSLAKNYPQGMIIKVNERSNVESFIMKCKERLCGRAQLEVALQTKNTLNKYLEKTEKTNDFVYQELLKYSKGARCTFPDFECTESCIWGAKECFVRLV